MNGEPLIKAGLWAKTTTALQTSTDNTIGAKVGDTQQLFAVGTTP
jgi:hypothetical protein